MEVPVAKAYILFYEQVQKPDPSVGCTNVASDYYYYE